MATLTYIIHNCPSVNFDDREVTLTGYKAREYARNLRQIAKWSKLQIGVYISKVGITVLEFSEGDEE